MTVRIYDSRSQRIVDFDPVRPGEASLYVCGPTVQSGPHIGHVRSALNYDVWRRWLEHRGHRTTLVRNVTDIDDKVLDNATDTEPWFALAYRVEREFNAAYAAVGVLPPTYEPRATGAIPEMIELIETLIKRGHAYRAQDGSADVYFDVRSWPEYGALTRQSVDDMEDAADADPRGKRDPRDFALWKTSKPGEPESASWPSPWGRGRPGWHIECSAMSRTHLGDEFDVHGGGIDLRFPHHENELAQSSAAGLQFARVWSHNGAVTVNGTKMSKSLGNSIYADELLERVRPIVVRYFLLAPHYRSVIDVRVVDGRFESGSLAEADAAFGRVEDFLSRAAAVESEAGMPEAFAAAMDEDLSTPQAIAVIHDTVRAGNAALAADDDEAAGQAAGQTRAMLAVLGLDPADPQWGPAVGTAADEALATLVQALIDDRATARAERDFARADGIRDALARAGIAIEDGKDSTTWSIA